MADVFLSYASEDRSRVKPIVNHLRDAGLSVWWDRSVKPGQPWTDAIAAELNKAKSIVVVWSEAALTSPWVRLEANKARERNILIPLTLDDVPLPPEIGVYQAIDFNDGEQGEALVTLEASVRSHIQRQKKFRLGVGSVVGIVLFLVAGGGVCTFTDACVHDSAVPADSSVAIIPFEILIQDEKVSGIAEVFVDELRDTLAGVKDQAVASRSAIRALPSGMPLPEIGQRLNVAWLVTGTITQIGAVLRFSVELVHADTGYLREGEVYEFSIDQLESYRTVMANDLLAIVKADGSRVQDERLDTSRNSEAYVLYLTGKATIREQHDTPRLDEAERLFKLALALEPEYPEAEAGLCSVFLWRYEVDREVDNFIQGEKHCQKALNLSGRSVDVAIALGNLYWYKGDTTRARESFARAFLLDPYSAEAQIGLADVSGAAGRPDEKEDHLRRAISNQPGYWRGYNELGIFLANTARADEAENSFERAIELSPANAGMLNNIGVSQVMNGQPKLAMKALERALSIEKDASTHANLGSVYFWLGDYRRAAEQYSLAVDETTADYRLWANLGDARIQLSDADHVPAYQKAIELIQSQLQVNPDDIPAQIGLAAIHAALGEKSQARKLLDDWSSSIAGDPGTAYVVAVAFARLGDRDATLSWLKRTVDEGFPSFILQADPAFNRFRGTADFDEFLGEAAT